jgi:hypothetical protein
MPFELDGRTYDLSHLHPKVCHYIQPAKADKPECRYEMDVFFSLHCFTRGFKRDEMVDPALHYYDKNETRIFDFARYELSKLLPNIFDGLERRKCYHTGKSNFLIIEAINKAGNLVEYEIFFTVSRSSRRGVLSLFVHSAYIRDAQHGQLSRRKPIGIHFILFNVLNNRPIKPPL